MKSKQTNNTGYRVAIVLLSGEIMSNTYSTKGEADDFILRAGEFKIAKILNRKTKEVEVVRF